MKTQIAMPEKKYKFCLYAACIFSGWLLALPFLFAELWWLAWIALAPLLIAIEKAPTYRQTARLCFAAGAVFFAASLYWLYHASLVGLIIAALYCGLYFVVFGVVLKFFLMKKNPSQVNLIFATPSIWIICEVLRTYLFTGFGWNRLGYSQFENIRLIQMADFSGVYGVSFLIVAVNVFFKGLLLSLKGLFFYKRKTILKQLSLAVICAAMILAAYAYGDIKLNNPLFRTETLRVSVIQGNIPQHEKWELFYQDLILQKYLRLSRMASFDRPELIVWPETALPGYLQEHDLYEQVSGFAKEFDVFVLVGAPRMESYGEGYYNSAVLFSPEGRIAGFHDKIHLVPFGEYIPFRRIFGFLSGYYPIADFSKGEVYTVFNVRNTTFAVLICFEDAFESLVRKFSSKKTDFMINITNDAWFYESAEPRQHLSASVFRAVENRISFVRAANTGISGFIDPYGRLSAKVSKAGKDVCVEGFSTADVLLCGRRSLYNRLGNFFAGICLVFLAAVFLKPSRV